MSKKEAKAAAEAATIAEWNQKLIMGCWLKVRAPAPPRAMCRRDWLAAKLGRCFACRIVSIQRYFRGRAMGIAAFAE